MPLASLGTTSWSLAPDNPADLVNLVHATGLNALQLGLSPIVTDRAKWATTVPRLIEANITLLSGMMAPIGEDYSTLESIAETGGVRRDGTWPANEEMARSMAVLAENAGIGMITLHAGFIPEDDSNPERGVMIERLQKIADIFAREGLCLALETGQESAEALLGILVAIDRPRVGVNFDPANMVLYGSGDPIEAMEILSEHIVQVHLKDALEPVREGRWGRETPLGKGDVDWDRFFQLAKELPREVDAIIEREGGDNRVGEIREAVDFVRTHLV
ncbi:MAG: sugar phosphate isomerase/epimerase [Phycisphaerae bacterium]|nr:sugar phosphate isomerase/epimerase [Phycisphaerae bacterium]MDG2477244.1 sugar phosphate isomerase/epimerase [Phycisphaerales bacterium]